MARSKQNKAPKKDGQHRAETKEERRARLEAEAEAREKCFQLLPYIGGVLVLIMILFVLYVHSVPPKVPKPKQPPVTNLAEEQAFSKVDPLVNVAAESSIPNHDEGDGEPDEETVEL